MVEKITICSDQNEKHNNSLNMVNYLLAWWLLVYFLNNYPPLGIVMKTPILFVHNKLTTTGSKEAFLRRFSSNSEARFRITRKFSKICLSGTTSVVMYLTGRHLAYSKTNHDI